MHLHRHSPEAAAFVADHIADGVSLEDALHDHAFQCEDCREAFSEKADVEYGENNDLICRGCRIEANENAVYGRRYGWSPA